MLNLSLAPMRLCLLACAIAFAFCGTARAQENPSAVAETGALSALLHEVRLLRVVLQNVNTSAKRLQLAAERIRLQQERVDKLQRDLEETRMQVTGVQVDQKRLDETLKELERQARQEAFPARRLEIENNCV